MPVLWLLRHAQASFASDDYDRLSERGHHQADLAGRRLRDTGSITRVVHGSLRRQADTALAALGPLARNADVDHRWDEFDQERLLVGQLAPAERPDGAARYDPIAMAAAIDLAVQRWAQPGDDADPAADEGFDAFRRAAEDAMESVWAAASGVTVAVTSAGVIAAIVARLLGVPASGWPALNRVMVNASLTKLVHGRRGTHLVSFNDHAHLEHDRSLVSYR